MHSEIVARQPRAPPRLLHFQPQTTSQNGGGLTFNALLEPLAVL